MGSARSCIGPAGFKPTSFARGNVRSAYGHFPLLLFAHGLFLAFSSRSLSREQEMLPLGPVRWRRTLPASRLLVSARERAACLRGHPVPSSREEGVCPGCSKGPSRQEEGPREAAATGLGAEASCARLGRASASRQGGRRLPRALIRSLTPSKAHTGCRATREQCRGQPFHRITHDRSVSREMWPRV